MSGALAIAAASAVLKDVLQNGMNALGIGGALQGAANGDVVIAVGAPDLVPTQGNNASSQLNVFLYNVARNPGWANLGLPSRSGKGDRIDNPMLGVDLYYLLTAYGSKAYDAEVLLGGAMQVLQDAPGLDRDEIRTALQAGVNLPPGVERSGLADQPEAIKITPLPMSTEEIVRLWSAFQCNYRPSVAYLVSVVLLQSVRSARRALPVRARNLYAVTFRQPRIDRVTRADDPNAAITPDALVRVVGANLDDPLGRIVVGGMDLTAGLVSRESTQLQFTLMQPQPAPALPAWPAGLYPGINGIHIVAPQAMGTPAVPHVAVESSVVPLLLAPTVTASKIAAGVRVKSDLPIGARQSVRLLLNERNAPAGRPPLAYGFDAPDGNGVTAPAVETSSIVIPVAGVSPGSYLVRLRVDGVESPLFVDGTGVYATPRVTL